MEDEQTAPEYSHVADFIQDSSSNRYIANRLAGIRKVLSGVHQGGIAHSNSTIGSEREALIRCFLSEVFPPHIRFGSGDATDSHGKKSGQLDVVIEFPWMPSLPVIHGIDSRLYLAEGIAAVIEVKSNIKSQWKEVEKTAKKLSKLDRRFAGGIVNPKSPENRVPLFAVGYTCLLYTSPSPRDKRQSRMPSSA